jgi:hypothetical protein
MNHEVFEEQVFKLLAFIGRCGHQDADAIARRRPVRWIEALADEIGKLMEEEAEAARRAQRE